MSENSAHRSPHLMCPTDTALLVIDVQEKLIPLVHEHQQVVWNIRRLLDGAKLFGLPILATEQYPQGLGATIAELSSRLESTSEKSCFSCAGATDFLEKLDHANVSKVLAVGIEAHVCVLQTTLDLLAQGYSLFIPVDAVGSRKQLDRDTALRRLDSAGATLTTTESTLFEWCEESGTPEFKQISQLVREAAP
jgi:nicotinamidase-related amidase